MLMAEFVICIEVVFVLPVVGNSVVKRLYCGCFLWSADSGTSWHCYASVVRVLSFHPLCSQTPFRGFVGCLLVWILFNVVQIWDRIRRLSNSLTLRKTSGLSLSCRIATARGRSWAFTEVWRRAGSCLNNGYFARMLVFLWGSSTNILTMFLLSLVISLVIAYR